MNKKIRSVSLSENIDNQLIKDSDNRGLTISANVSRILYEYFISNDKIKNHKRKVLISKQN
tara:strand:+ start:1018 stop:1200 length:183 start_codon:yes stop_codon:yes gene_type:complete